MARDTNDAPESSASRRTFMKTVGLAATAAGGSAVFGSRGSAQSVVDLGEQGLESGELIDPYLDEHFEDGAEVRIPAGEYRFEGGGMGYGMANASLIGSPEGVVFRRPDDPEQTVRPSVLATEGTVRIENITYRGVDGVAQSRWRVGAAEGARMEVVNVNFPDGSVDNSDSTGLYTGTDHGGELWLKNCYLEGFGNVALYLSDPFVGENGRIVVEDCVLRNTNASMIRFAPDDSVVRGCYFEATELPPSEEGYGTVLRGIKFDDGGDNVVVEDCDFYWSDLGHNVIDFHERGAGGSGVIRNCRIHNDSTSAVIDTDWDVGGHWSGENLHLTGSGNLSLPAGFEGVTGDEAAEPDTDYAVWDPVSGESDDTTTTEPASTDWHELTISGGSPDSVVEYSFAVSESVENGGQADQWDSIGDSTVEGAVGGGGDSYRFTGEITTFEATGELTVTLDGETVDQSQLGQSSETETETDTGTETESQPELDRTIRIDGGSTSNAVEYTVTVSEGIAPGEYADEWDSVSSTTAEGAVGGGGDSYDFAGEVTGFEATGDVTVTVDGEEVDPAQLGTDDPELTHTVRITGNDDADTVEYSLATSEGLAPGPDTNPTDSVSGLTAQGTVGGDGGEDSYDYAGQITDFAATGDVIVSIDGRQVDPDLLGTTNLTDPPELNHTVRVTGSDSADLIEYALSVSERLVVGPDTNPEDSVSGLTAQGAVGGGGGEDSYDFAGEVTGFEATGDVTVTVDSEEVDPTQFGPVDGVDLGDGSGDDSTDGSDGSDDDSTDGSDGSDDGSEDTTEFQKILLIDGSGDASETARYVVSVSGTMTRDEEHSEIDTQASPWDSLEDNVESDRVVGIVGNGVDAYQYTGTLQTVDIRGEATFTIIRE